MSARLLIATAIVAPILVGCGQTARVAPAPIVAPATQRMAPSPAPLRPVIRPCPAEDSAGPCYWNAGNRGNGRGHSFVVNGSGRVTYVSAAYVAELDRVNGSRR